MPKHTQPYGNDSISSLKGADRVRKRPGVIFGSDGLEGCQHAVFEILSNAIDEAREGHGDVITVTRFNDLSVEVEDFGRGCPVDWNEAEGRFNWELVFCELYAGGKYDNDAGESYEYSLGLNGLGSCATQYSSEYMDVVIHRDGKKYTLRFEKGENVGGLTSEPYSGKRTGTTIRWRPDLDVFTDVAVPAEYFTDTLKRQAVVNRGVTFRFKNQLENGQFESSDFLYENGIVDYVNELAGAADPDDDENSGGALTKTVFAETERRGRDREDKPEYKVKLSAAFCFSNLVTVTEYYHNSSWLEHGGAPEKAAKSAFVSELDGFLKKNGKYQKNETKISWNDVTDCLILVTNCFSTQTSYENQTKKAITNKFIQESMTDFLRAQLEVFFLENPAEAARAADQVLINKRSRETAEKARLNIKKKLSGSLDIANRVEKFVDCRTRDTERREIYIVEGDSALGACKLSRDAEFQGIMPVRGKILNCLKADYERIFKSEIITNLLKVLGCGVEIQNKHSRDLSAFDLASLRWKRVIICTDADEDGFHIRTLILTMIYRLVPTLIERGFVYIAESPLFELNCGGKTYFAYSEREKNDIVSGFDGAKHTISRSKGLGENDPEMMWLTTMNPETRRLIKVMPEDARRTSDTFDLLLGDNLQGRKEHIADNGYKYLDIADVS
jgi:DNA gyrase subunit B